jgi:hypothetical protein
MALPIPKRYIPEIQKIRNLSDASVDELLHALESSGFAPTAAKAATKISTEIQSIEHDDLNGILSFIYDLYNVRDFSELNRRVFLDELVAAVVEHTKPKAQQSDIPNLRERFKRILGLKNLNTISKAANLQRTGERVYCDATIISDLRPVFGEDVKSSPVAGVVTHMLKIAYHEDGAHRHFFVTLDDVDLRKLAEAIQRARQKSEAITGLLETLKTPRLGI